MATRGLSSDVSYDFRLGSFATVWPVAGRFRSGPPGPKSADIAKVQKAQRPISSQTTEQATIADQ